jgi:hypothetical protein
MNATLKLFKVIDLNCNEYIITNILKEKPILDRDIYYQTIPLFYAVDKYINSLSFKALFDIYNGYNYTQTIEYCIDNISKKNKRLIDYDRIIKNVDINQYINYKYNKLIYYNFTQNLEKEIQKIQEIAKIININLFKIPKFCL